MHESSYIGINNVSKYKKNEHLGGEEFRNLLSLTNQNSFLMNPMDSALQGEEDFSQ